ncbi:hypothetical protein G6F68_013039 [Rhizopus microsporus]|nr:hypothetical protein G6F68_013039 [Rhizopus microsporus]
MAARIAAGITRPGRVRHWCRAAGGGVLRRGGRRGRGALRNGFETAVFRVAVRGGRDGRRAARLRQGLADGVRHEAVHGAAVAEADLVFGRVHVHVHGGGVDVQEQHVGRLAVAMQHVRVGGAQRMAAGAVAHVAAVHVQVLAIGAGARGRRAGDHAGQADGADRMRQQQAVLGEFGAQHVADALRRFRRQPLALRAVVVEQAECDLRVRQRDALHRVDAVAEFAGARPRWCPAAPRRG